MILGIALVSARKTSPLSWPSNPLMTVRARSSMMSRKARSWCSDTRQSRGNLVNRARRVPQPVDPVTALAAPTIATASKKRTASLQDCSSQSPVFVDTAWSCRSTGCYFYASL